MRLISQKYGTRQRIHTARMLEMSPSGRNVVVDVGGIQTEWRLYQKRGGRPLFSLPRFDNVGFATYKTVQHDVVLKG